MVKQMDLKIILLLLIALISLVGCGKTDNELVLATTTSVDATGLLEHILPPFKEEHQCEVKVVAVGTGRALKLGENGDADAVMVHAREAEEDFIERGFGVDWHEIMYNYFVIVGPPEDPAGIIEAADACEAFKKLQTGNHIFISRGDESGTHMREKLLWECAEVSIPYENYLEAGRGMGVVLLMASERYGYTLSDKATYLSMKNALVLKIFYENDPMLYNPYSIMAVNPEKHPELNYDLATEFIDYMIDSETQQKIGNYTIEDEKLFYPFYAE
jgi:tungstate transport system substrate-binding protein